MTLKKILVILTSLIFVLYAGAYTYSSLVTGASGSPPPESVKLKSLSMSEIPGDSLELIVENIGIPWEILFLPDGDILVSIRDGNILRIDTSGNIIDDTKPKEVNPAGTTSGGSLGMALHPDFKDNSWIYLFQTVQKDGPVNRVARYTYSKEGGFAEKKIIVDDIPAAPYHNGGRIKFGPDKMLYITTGDGDTPQSSQDSSTLYGKILRVHDDGQVPEDNPFGTLVWSYGHRNPQGITWDGNGNTWSTEHGNAAHDELNLIEPGNNYGWPTIIGTEKMDGLVTPALESGEAWTWAPSALESVGNSLFFAGLRGESLFEARLDSNQVKDIMAHLSGDLGRIRVVRIGPDGDFYLATSNTDGQGGGVVRDGDNKIIKIDRSIFVAP